MSTTETITLTPSKPPEPPAMGSQDGRIPPEPAFVMFPFGQQFRQLAMLPIREVIARQHGVCIAVGCKCKDPAVLSVRMDLELAQAEDLHRQLTAAITALKITLAGGAQ